MVPLVESKFGGWGAWGGVNHSFSLQGQKLAEHLLCARPHSRQWGAAGNKTPFPCEVHLLVWEDLTRVGEREEGGARERGCGLHGGAREGILENWPLSRGGKDLAFTWSRMQGERTKPGGP